MTVKTSYVCMSVVTNRALNHCKVVTKHNWTERFSFEFANQAANVRESLNWYLFQLHLIAPSQRILWRIFFKCKKDTRKYYFTTTKDIIKMTYHTVYDSYCFQPSPSDSPMTLNSSSQLGHSTAEHCCWSEYYHCVYRSGSLNPATADSYHKFPKSYHCNRWI